MEHNYEFEGDRILLKPLLHEDIENLRLLRNELREFFVTQDIITVQQQEQWYQNYLKKENDIMFKVVMKDKPNIFIGAIAIYDINLESKIAECGRSIIDKRIAPEKGIGREATSLSCQFAFEVLKLKKTVAEVLKTNARNIIVVKRAGFRFVGERDNVYLIEMTEETINKVYKNRERN